MFAKLFYFLPENRKRLHFLELSYVANMYDFKIYAFICHCIYLKCDTWFAHIYF
jgi:hypothetical protein